jgi:phospholipid/cholesterol/gamma-HCH transport system ATP-binding protein
VGAEIRVDGLSTSSGGEIVWSDVSLIVPAGEISVLLGPSGTGKSQFLRTLVGLARPDKGSIWIGGRDLTRLSARELNAVRRRFGVLFQDGALFGSLSLFDNVAFPLREHTRKSGREIAALVGEKLELVGLSGSARKLPAEVSAGTRKRAGLARALILDPDVVLFDEPGSGLDPVRAAHLSQLIVDLNQRTGASFLIVTHDVAMARTVPDNIGLLFRGRLVQFGPREMLLTSQDPVVRQFLTAQRTGPIGAAEEDDADAATVRPGALPPIPLQLAPSDGRPRISQRPPGEWLLAHGVEPPPGSFAADPLRPPLPVPAAAAVVTAVAPAVATAAETAEPDKRSLDEPTVELPRLVLNPRVLARTRAAQRPSPHTRPQPGTQRLTAVRRAAQEAER